jgi:V/A-type H+/Na+-transporting ATPase subunit E
MDELRSSDALEREIKDDSRKKAERLFKQADDAIRLYRESSAAQAEAEIQELTAKYAERTEAHRAEVMARLPMEKKRKRIEWAQLRLDAALEAHLSRMDSAGLLSLMAGRLAAASEHFKDKEYTVSLTGIDAPSAIAALSKSLPGFSADALAEKRGAGPRGIRMATTDSRISFETTQDSIKEGLLDVHRRELVEALLGKVDEL